MGNRSTQRYPFMAIVHPMSLIFKQLFRSNPHRMTSIGKLELAEQEYLK